jgi:hypothetical protein
MDPAQNTIVNSSTNVSSYMSDLFADEDIFDQPLCLIARYLGIDTVIFTHMIGLTRIVQEVMDSRTREESYNSIATMARSDNQK